MTARKDPPGAAFASIRDTRCSTCARILVEQRRWQALSRLVRKRLNKTHARHYADGVCHTCATWRTRQPKEPTDIAYRGGWVRDGRVLRPHPQGSPLKYFGERAS